MSCAQRWHERQVHRADVSLGEEERCLELPAERARLLVEVTKDISTLSGGLALSDNKHDISCVREQHNKTHSRVLFHTDQRACEHDSKHMSVLNQAARTVGGAIEQQQRKQQGRGHLQLQPSCPTCSVCQSSTCEPLSDYRKEFW